MMIVGSVHVLAWRSPVRAVPHQPAGCIVAQDCSMQHMDARASLEASSAASGAAGAGEEGLRAGGAAARARGACGPGSSHDEGRQVSARS